MLSQPKIQQTFQRALASYDEQAVVQKQSASTLLDHLAKCNLGSSLDRVFEFGCGTGFLTQPLSEQFIISDFIVNDLVADCEKYLTFSEISFIAGDVDNILIPSHCDLICSASCVQWSANLATLLNRLTDALNRQGYLAVSSYSSNHFKELAKLEELTTLNNNSKLNYWSELDWQKHLEPNYDIQLITTEQNSLWFTSVRELLKHLRLTGVNGYAGQHWSKQNLSQFETDYHDNFEVDGKVPLTYEPIYIIARKRSQQN